MYNQIKKTLPDQESSVPDQESSVSDQESSLPDLEILSLIKGVC